MSMPGYWDGTVTCPRKALSHINHKRCLDMYDETACDGCGNKDRILELQAQEREEEEARRAERRALKPKRRGEET